MKLTQAFLSVAALGVLGAGAYFGAVAAIEKAISGTVRGSHTGNSPILASGGSMTFRAVGGWSCDTAAGTPHTKCVSVSKVAMSTLDWDNVFPQSSSGTLGWTGLSTAWTLDLYANDNQYGGGIHMCTASSGVIASATCDSSGTSYSGSSSQAYLLIATTGKTTQNHTTLNLVDSTAYDADAGDTAIHAVQYYDPDCGVHSNSKIPNCEHPKVVQTSLDSGNKYKCRHGNCQIAIYQ